MKRTLRAAALLLCVVLLFTSFSFAVEKNTLSSYVTKSAAYLLKTVPNPTVNSVGGEWAVMGLCRSGYAVPKAWLDGYYANLESQVQAKKGVLHQRKYTEYSRVVLALTAMGADPTKVAGYNLLAPLGDFDKTVWQGVNGAIWALIALDSGNYDGIRQKYIDEILSKQLPDGGWNLTGSGNADADVTGMALQALSRYQSQSKVKTATGKALTCLSSMQNNDGGFGSGGDDNVESCAQVLVALCQLGIGMNDSRFVKNGKSVLDKLLSYRNIDGSFCHTKGGKKDQLATEQGFYAMVAALRFLRGEKSLYRMENTRRWDVQVPAATAKGASFSDIASHKDKAAIEALAARKILSGMGDGKFCPNETMTRAQFATVAVKALGLTQKAGNPFADVSPRDWFSSYVAAANAYGIVNGRNATHFDPGSTITRQEAAVMVARAAKLCGMDTDLTDSETKAALAKFTDGSEIAVWAKKDLAFCRQSGILDSGKAEPNRAILRCEIAEMIYNMLTKAKLL